MIYSHHGYMINYHRYDMEGIMTNDTLREMRAVERMSQSYLGLILGINQSAVSGLLIRDMSVSKFLAICDALG